MVNLATIRGYTSPMIVVAAGQPLLQRLEPERRVKVLAALAALIILGFAMVLLTWLGARVTRRYMNQSDRHFSQPERKDDWVHKRTVDNPSAQSDE